MTGSAERYLMAVPERHVARPRLVAAASAQRVAFLAAGSGFGKTVAGAEIAAAHRGSVTATSLQTGDRTERDVLRRIATALGLREVEDGDDDLEADVARMIRRLDREQRPVLLLVDEVTTHAALDAVARLAAVLRSPHRLLVLGTDVPSIPAERADEVAVLTQADLAFTVEETRMLLTDQHGLALSDAVTRELCAATSGWITALRSTASLIEAAGDPESEARALLSDGLVLDALLGRLLDRMRTPARDALVQLAHLPLVDTALVQALGLHETVEAIRRSGVPVEAPDRGPWAIADAARDRLRAAADPQLDLVRSAAVAYTARGDALLGAEVLADTGLLDEAAALLAGLPADAVLRLEPRRLVDAIDALPPAERRAHPRLHLQQARACTVQQAYRRREQVIDEGLTLTKDDAALARALEAERLRDLAYFTSSPAPADIARARALLDVDSEEPDTRGRLHEGLALLLLRRGEPGDTDDAAQSLRQAAIHYQRSGETRLAAVALRNLAWHIHLEAGRLDLVIATLDEVEPILDPRDRFSAWRCNRAEAHLIRGDVQAARADLTEATRLGTLHGDDQTLSYAAWTTAVVESMCAEPLRTLAAVGRADHLCGDWFDTATGALFLAQTSDALARAGLEADARQRLQRAQARREEDPRAVMTAELGMDARLGDPARAILTHRSLLAEHPLEPFEAPRLALLAAYAAMRLGDVGSAEEAARAFVAYDAIGLRDAAAVHEPTAARALAAPAAALGAPVPTTLEPTSGGMRPPLPTGGDPATALAAELGVRQREAEVLWAMRTGASNSEVAAQLGISPGTVRKHLERAYRHLGLRSRSEAVALLARLDLRG